MWIKVDNDGASRVVRALRGKTDPAIAAVRDQIKKKLAAPPQSEVLDLAELTAVVVAVEHLMVQEYAKETGTVKQLATAAPKLRARMDRMVQKHAEATLKNSRS